MKSLEPIFLLKIRNNQVNIIYLIFVFHLLSCGAGDQSGNIDPINTDTIVYENRGRGPASEIFPDQDSVQEIVEAAIRDKITSNDDTIQYLTPLILASENIKKQGILNRVAVANEMEIKNGLTFYVDATLGSMENSDLVDRFAKSAIESINPSVTESNIHFLFDSIFIIDSIELHLSDPSETFKITPTGEHVKRPYNPDEIMKWTWSVVSIKELIPGEEKRLLLRLITKNDDGQPKSKFINLKVKASISFLETIANEIRDIPWLVGIIGGALAFLIGLYFKIKANQKS